MKKNDYYPFHLAGEFSFEKLNQYSCSSSLSEQDIYSLTRLDALSKTTLESLLGTSLEKRDYYLIKEFGLSAGALLIKEIDWELAALVSGDPHYNCIDEMISLSLDNTFRCSLTNDELNALDFLRDSIGHSNLYSMTLKNYQYRDKRVE